ncbi:MAG: GPR endopeptidase [Bacilli bacterium]|nr:GPR endopeptidase [Bacilli bacterium]
MNNNRFNFRTDMADERVDTYKKINNLTEIDGVKVITDKFDNFAITTVDVLNDNGADALQKEIGKYITMEINDIKYLDNDTKDSILKELSNQIKSLIGNDNSKSVLVVGLGNEYVTPDSLGPKVIKNVEITRHLIHFAKELVEPNTREVSGICPGVLGTTGIETSEIISSVCGTINPDIVIVIDSLASSSIQRLGNTIQLSNTGIKPGAGVRNKREGINEKSLNIPVIAIGVPTVVDMATITNETIDKMLDETKSQIESTENVDDKEVTVDITNILDDKKRYELVEKVLDNENLIVTPKEIDDVIQIVSEIISDGINMSVN